MHIHPQLRLMDGPGAHGVFAFFPYLKTSQPVRFRGVQFRSTDDTAGLEEDAIFHVRALSSMFFLCDDLRIRRMAYAFLPPHSNGQAVLESLSRLGEVRDLLAYLYSAPRPVFGDIFLSSEHANLYVFWPKRVSAHLLWPKHNVERVDDSAPRPESDAEGQLDGYEGLLNGNSFLWVAPGSRIYPVANRMWLNMAQDLVELSAGHPVSRRNRLVVDALCADSESQALDDPTLTALEWYARSTSADITDDLAIVHLAIAFESLLELEPHDKTRERFKQAVIVLLGVTSRLDSWLEQFYTARSELVHEGSSANLMFRAVDSPRGNAFEDAPRYGSLIMYGRQIFQACLGAKCAGRSMSVELRLASQLSTNRERIQRICRALDGAGGTPEDRIVSVRKDIEDIATYQFVPEGGLSVPDLLGAARRIAGTYIETISAEEPEVLAKLKGLSECSMRTQKDQYRALALVRGLVDEMASSKQCGMAGEPDVRDLAARLLRSVWQYCFMHYFHLERVLKGDGNSDKGSHA